jgi:hypothetical protein
MNIVYTVINDLSEIDFDDLYERSKDAIDANWPAGSSLTNAERKAAMIALIESGANNEWPGLNPHGPNDRYVMAKFVDLDTGKDLGFVSGFILEDGTLDGRHLLTAPDENGSRNYVFNQENATAKNNFNIQIGVTKHLYRNIPANSIYHKTLRIAANAGNYELLEDVDSPTFGPNFRNILIQLNL